MLCRLRGPFHAERPQAVGPPFELPEPAGGWCLAAAGLGKHRSVLVIDDPVGGARRRLGDQAGAVVGGHLPCGEVVRPAIPCAETAGRQQAYVSRRRAAGCQFDSTGRNARAQGTAGQSARTCGQDSDGRRVLLSAVGFGVECGVKARHVEIVGRARAGWESEALRHAGTRAGGANHDCRGSGFHLVGTFSTDAAEASAILPAAG